MLKTVKLYGELAENYGEKWSLDVSSPAEAIRALTANNPGFRQFVCSSSDRGVGYKVIVGDYELQDVKSEISAPTGAQTIKIVPVIGGAKSSIGKIILGGILIYASFQMGFGTEGLTAMQGFGANMAMSLGVSLVMGGVAEMLAPTPQAPKETNLADNKSMGPINTTLQGVGIPVCYGQMIVGGATISAGVTTEDRSCIVVSDLLNLPGKFGEALNGSIFGAEGGLICPS